jgi:tetratricopeptide (TPR) repeat protein
MERWTANSQSLKKVNALFIEGKVDDAFNMIETLRQKDPLEFRFSFAHDSLVSELRNMADEKFNQKDFPAAVIYYMALKNHEEPVRFETVRKISLCQYYLGNFKESLQSLKHLHNQRPGDMELVYQIGIINLEKLDNPQEALYYFSLGKKLFKENLTKVYGEAFEVVMDPADAPDIYYEVFRARARTNLMLNNFDDAVKDCNWAIYLRPYKPDPFKMRAQANLRLKKMDNICFDLHQARKYGANDVDLQLRKHCY